MDFAVIEIRCAILLLLREQINYLKKSNAYH